MRQSFPARRFRSPWLTFPLFAALLCRAFVPLGFMPAPGGLMLCPSYAPLPPAMAALHLSDTDMSDMDMTAMAMPMHHPHSPGDPARDHDDGAGMGHGGMGICPFAGAATLMAAMEVPPALQQLLQVVRLAPAVPDLRVPAEPLTPSRLPRGPPALA